MNNAIRRMTSKLLRRAVRAERSPELRGRGAESSLRKTINPQCTACPLVQLRFAFLRGGWYEHGKREPVGHDPYTGSRVDV
jgi:hypothetical protein